MRHANVTAGDLFRLVRSGQAASRADLVRTTGLSASTVAGRVADLIDGRYLEETGEGTSSGGRRPRMLAVSSGTRVVAGVDLGENHVTIVLMDRAGTIVASHTDDISLAAGPTSVLAAVTARIEALRRDAAPDRTLSGVAMSLPGPIDAHSGQLLAPTRMPGWSGIAVAPLLTEATGVAALVENDANALALGEIAGRGEAARDLIYVKAGSGIGCGIIASGALHRGYRGVAGDISHVTLTGVPPITCSCGRTGCLDVVASGAAIIDELREHGSDITDVDGLLRLAERGDTAATGLLRQAGQRLGGVLATIVNFFNPRTLVLGGQLSTADPFLAGIRQEIYTQCLPMTTDLLKITISTIGPLGAARGVAFQLQERLLAPESINAALAAQGE